MAYRRRRSASRRRMPTRRRTTGRSRWSMNSRAGRGRYRRRAAVRGREVRLVIQAPRGILQPVVTTGSGLRYRRSRRY